MSETPAKYLATPPLLRPLNPTEHRQLTVLNDALTQAKISLGDRHAELRMMRVAVEVLTGRALKAEAQVKESALEVSYFRQMNQQSEEAMIKLAARVKEQQAELAEQEVAKMELIHELAARPL